jgi:hypothetical protein
MLIMDARVKPGHDEEEQTCVIAPVLCGAGTPYSIPAEAGPSSCPSNAEGMERREARP